MTMTLKIEHVSGSSYAALIKAEGDTPKLIKEGESVEIGIHSGKSITVEEVGADFVLPDAAANEAPAEGEAVEEAKTDQE